MATAWALAGASAAWGQVPAPGDLRLMMGGVQPDTGRNVNGLRSAVSLLLESRGVGIGTLHLARRVQSHGVALRTVLRQAARQADDLLRLQAQADAEVQAAGTPTRREVLMLDPLTGADQPVTVAWESALQWRVLTERARPCGYWLDSDQQAAVAGLQALGACRTWRVDSEKRPQRGQFLPDLQAHSPAMGQKAGEKWTAEAVSQPTIPKPDRLLGVQVQRLVAPARLQAEAWIETARGEMARPDVRGVVADGERTLLRLVVDLRPGPLDALPGQFFVPLDQPLANLVIAALEPNSQNSYLANRLIDRLEVVQRVLVAPAGGLAPL